MKFSDLDKNLVTEAPAADGGDKEGKLARMGTKLKQKLGPTKGMRQRATGKAEIQQQGLDIKGEFQNWIGKFGKPITVGSFKEFANAEYPNLVNFIDKVAVDLEFAPAKKEKEPEEEPKAEPQAQPDDSADQKADVVDPDEEQEELLSPEEMTGEKSADEDEVEEEVDMSASIYESRLAYFLIEEAKLKDNQLDTLIVRVLQAAQSGGKAVSTGDSEKAQAEPEEKESLLKKAGKMYNKGMNVAFGELHGRDAESSDEEVTDSGKVVSDDDSKKIGADEYDQLTNLLNVIQKSTKPLDQKHRTLAKQLLNKIQHANS